MCVLLAVTSTLAAPAAPTSSTNSTLTNLPTSITNGSSSSAAAAAAASVNKTDMKISLLHQLLPQAARPRKRHSKRQSNNFDILDLYVNSTVLEWDNPCGGFFDPTAVTHQKPNRTAILKKLGEAVNYEFIEVKNGPNFIDDEIELWSLYEERFRFLPKLKKKRKIALKRWYRNIQTYTAAFTYLWRVQQKSLRSKTDSQVASELKTLMRSSRAVLCELEIAINKTHPNHRVRNHLSQVKRDDMNRRLKLITRQKAIQNPGVDPEVNSIDLTFTKVYYKRFLKKMGKSINIFLQRPRTPKAKIAHKNEGNRRFGNKSHGPRQTKQQKVLPSRA